MFEINNIIQKKIEQNLLFSMNKIKNYNITQFNIKIEKLCEILNLYIKKFIRLGFFKM